MNKFGFLTQEQIERLSATYSTPLWVIDCAQIRQQYELLSQVLPKVVFYYAIKCCPHPAVIKTLQQCGASFDVATNGEIDLLKAQSITSEKVIHTHPIKKDSDIRYALDFNCTTFVVDNVSEIDKLLPYKDQAQLLLRLSIANKNAVVDLSSKFGCTKEDAPKLLEYAHKKGLKIRGLSFHIGSQNKDPKNHVEAIRTSVDIATAFFERFKVNLSVIDIGGGFPVDYGDGTLSITDYCKEIAHFIEHYRGDLQFIAEPGRCLAGPSGMTISAVVGKASRNGKPWYYLDEGVYGLFSGIIYDHAKYPLKTLKQGPLVPCVLAGPTCDGIDIVASDIPLPELEIGDLVISSAMGAYTMATSSEFNAIPKSRVVVLNESP